MSIQSEFKERLTRDVTRSLRHLVGSENATVMDGIVTLQISNGVLTDIELVGALAKTEYKDVVLDTVAQDTMDTPAEKPKAKSKR